MTLLKFIFFMLLDFALFLLMTVLTSIHFSQKDYFFMALAAFCSWLNFKSAVERGTYLWGIITK